LSRFRNFSILIMVLRLQIERSRQELLNSYLAVDRRRNRVGSA
jgi:hypothetical protein